MVFIQHKSKKVLRNRRIFISGKEMFKTELITQDAHHSLQSDAFRHYQLITEF